MVLCHSNVTVSKTCTPTQTTLVIAAPFDHIAPSYDLDFTQTAIGQYQREIVWNYLKRTLPQSSLQILEVNCGTGEDALFLAQMGHQLLATDISSEMVKQTTQKALAANTQLQAQICSIENSVSAFNTSQFDLVFSNFGGLNCVSPESLKKWSQDLPQILQPKARIIGVIMPKFCLWESISYLKKRQVKAAFRRCTSQAVIAQVGESSLPIWYYSPRDIKRYFSRHFKIKTCKPVGSFLPPSYLEPFFRQKPNLLKSLNSLESKVQHLSAFAAISDHFLIDLELKEGHS